MTRWEKVDLREHKQEIIIPSINIQEALTEHQIKLIYPVMRQLRTAFTDINTFVFSVKRIQQSGYRVYFASCNQLLSSNAIGVIGLRLQEDLCWGRHIYIDDLVVDENFQNRGIGRQLMTFARDLAISESCQCLRLASGLEKYNAHGFYDHIGYKRTSYTFAYKISDS